MLEEAKKRDHRKIGRRWGCSVSTTMSAPACRSGCPKGAVLIEELEKLAKETEFAAGYQRVHTPHIARENMYVVQRASALLRGVDVSADGADWKKRRKSDREDSAELMKSRAERGNEMRKSRTTASAARGHCEQD